jgi:hypothetical protein
MSTEVPPQRLAGRMANEKLRQLQEYGSSISRLAIPAPHRDALNLADGQPVTFELVCVDGEPAVRIETENTENADAPATRIVQIDENSQATITFPRPIAAAVGFRDTDLELTVEDSTLLVRRH